MQKTRIDWGIPDLYTWNVITGCQRNCSVNGKSYCYARRIHERFNKTPFEDIVYHPERLHDPIKHKKSCTIFVGSMSDPEYWYRYEISKIIDIMIDYQQHTFMFLSKNPDAYRSEQWRYMPRNMMQGLTLTKMDTVPEFNIMMDIAKMPRPFLSIEPLLGPVEGTIPFNFERIIIGAMTGPGAVPVKLEWIESIRKNIEPNRIFWKESMKKYLKGQKI